MKKSIFVFTLLLFTLLSFSQDVKENQDNKLFVYDTYEDFINDKGKFLGVYTSYIWNNFGGNKLIVTNNSKKSKIGVNKYWGFKLNGLLFRNKKGSPKIPVMVTHNKDKIFYTDGYFYLGYLIDGTFTSSRSTDALFYSDTFESKIYTIDKLAKNEKKNASLSKLVNCLKKAKKRYGYQAKFNSYSKCIDNHASN